MKKAYFFRDIRDISDLRKRTAKAIQNQVTPIKYSVYLILEINDNEFNKFLSQIKIGHPILLNYRNKMIADDMGVWNCIVIANKKHAEKIAVYYGGFKYPRFVALV